MEKFDALPRSPPAPPPPSPADVAEEYRWWKHRPEFNDADRSFYPYNKYCDEPLPDFENVTCVRRCGDQGPRCVVHGSASGRAMYLEGDQPDSCRMARRICTCRDLWMEDKVVVEVLRDDSSPDGPSFISPFVLKFRPVVENMLDVLHDHEDGIRKLWRPPQPSSRELLQLLNRDPPPEHLVITPDVEGYGQNWFKPSPRPDDEVGDAVGDDFAPAKCDGRSPWDLSLQDRGARLNFASSFFRSRLDGEVFSATHVRTDLEELLQPAPAQAPADGRGPFADLHHEPIFTLKKLDRSGAVDYLLDKRKTNANRRSELLVAFELAGLVEDVLDECRAFEQLVTKEAPQMIHRVGVASVLAGYPEESSHARVVQHTLTVVDVTHFALKLRLDNLRMDVAHLQVKQNEIRQRIQELRTACLEGRLTNSRASFGLPDGHRSCCGFISAAYGKTSCHHPFGRSLFDEIPVSVDQTLSNLRNVSKFLDNSLLPFLRHCLARTATLLQLVAGEYLNLARAVDARRGPYRAFGLLESSEAVWTDYQASVEPGQRWDYMSGKLGEELLSASEEEAILVKSGEKLAGQRREHA